MSTPKRGNPLFDLLRKLLKNKPSERMLAAITKGKKWDSLIARVPPNYYQYRPESFRRIERAGILFDLDLSEYMQWLIYYGVVTEPREALYNLVKPGMTVVDIGANIGETTLKFSRLAGTSGKVISFEPFPATYSRLIHHIALNNADNIIPINKAVGNVPSTLRMNSVAGNSGGNRIDDRSGNTEVDVITLDEWSQTQPAFTPHLIKIDVEGYELKVLQGASEILKKYSPVLFLEVNPEFLNRAGNTEQELFTFLDNLGYQMRDAEDENIITPGKPLKKSHFDFIAIKK